MMGNDDMNNDDVLEALQEPVPYDSDWSEADYAAEILKRTERLLAYYQVDMERLQSHDAAIETLCRILFDWVPGLRAEHMARLTASAPAGAIFGERGSPFQPGVAQPVSDRLSQALQQYRTLDRMDRKKSKRAELERFVERSVAAAPATSQNHRKR